MKLRLTFVAGVPGTTGLVAWLVNAKELPFPQQLLQEETTFK